MLPPPRARPPSGRTSSAALAHSPSAQGKIESDPVEAAKGQIVDDAAANRNARAVGADDYITKPFDTEVLIFKLKAILKRQSGTPSKESDYYKIGSYLFDYKLRTIEHDSDRQKLSPKEADLLKMLCDNQNELLPRETALRKIWGDDGYFTGRSMDVYLTKLRKLFADDPSVEIRNIHGSGFILEIKTNYTK